MSPFIFSMTAGLDKTTQLPSGKPQIAFTKRSSQPKNKCSKIKLLNMKAHVSFKIRMSDTDWSETAGWFSWETGGQWHTRRTVCFECKHVDFPVPFDRALHFVESVIYNQQPEAVILHRCLVKPCYTDNSNAGQCSCQFGQDTVFYFVPWRGYVRTMLE